MCFCTVTSECHSAAAQDDFLYTLKCCSYTQASGSVPKRKKGKTKSALFLHKKTFEEDENITLARQHSYLYYAA